MQLSQECSFSTLIQPSIKVVSGSYQVTLDSYPTISVFPVNPQQPIFKLCEQTNCATQLENTTFPKQDDIVSNNVDEENELENELSDEDDEDLWD